MTTTLLFPQKEDMGKGQITGSRFRYLQNTEKKNITKSDGI
jgi:hypothetical protein